MINVSHLAGIEVRDHLFPRGGTGLLGDVGEHRVHFVAGLDHRRTGRTCMRDGFATMYGHPDAADYANLRRIYANAAPSYQGECK